MLGTPAPRAEIAAMATGQFEFVQNVRVPGMLHGAVVRPPAVGATLVSVDEASVRAMPGFVKVVVKNNFVGVVCQKPWQAMQAAAALKAAWTDGAGLPPQREFYEYLQEAALARRVRRQLEGRRRDAREGPDHHQGDLPPPVPDARLDGPIGRRRRRAGRQGDGLVVDAVRVPDAQRRGEAARRCPPTTSASSIRKAPAATGSTARTRWRTTRRCCRRPSGSRCACSSRARTRWRGRTTAWPYVIDQRAGVGADGTIIAWDHEAWFASLGGRPGYETPGNVVTGMLAGFPTAPFRPAQAAEPAGEFNNGSNAAPSYVSGRVAGTAGGAGTIASERVLVHTVRSPFFTGPLRSPSRLQNTFAHECFLDEVAAHVKADPVAYRLRHLSDPRLKEVVAAAAKAANWEARPSPRPGLAKTGIASGRGFSCVVYEGDNGYIAMVAEVDVDQATGKVIARRLVVAQDCGPVSNPDGMRNQLEGGALQGLSRALGEEVTWDDRKVTSVDWRTYHSLPLGFEVPAIESVLINRHRRRGERRRRDGDHDCRRRGRQRDLRRDRRAGARGAIHRRPRQGRIDVAASVEAEALA